MTSTTAAFSLQGKRILVTGASSGLGRQIAVSAARLGAQLVITGRHEARLAETFAALEGGGHQQVCADLTVPNERDTLVAQTAPIDGLVHSAGIVRLSPVKLLSEAALRDIFDINFFAPVALTQRLLYRGAINSGGAIVFVSSISARSGVVGVGPYAASKSAMHGLMRCLAVEQAKRKVRVNCLVPSAVDTPLWKEKPPAQFERHPLGVGTPEDIANAAIFLLSDASRWITGTELVIDGGAVAVS